MFTSKLGRSRRFLSFDYRDFGCYQYFCWRLAGDSNDFLSLHLFVLYRNGPGATGTTFSIRNIRAMLCVLGFYLSHRDDIGLEVRLVQGTNG
jgi:hypothetical protein